MFKVTDETEVLKCLVGDFLIFPDYPPTFGLDCPFADLKPQKP